MWLFSHKRITPNSVHLFLRVGIKSKATRKRILKRLEHFDYLDDQERSRLQRNMALPGRVRSHCKRGLTSTPEGAHGPARLDMWRFWSCCYHWERFCGLRRDMRWWLATSMSRSTITNTSYYEQRLGANLLNIPTKSSDFTSISLRIACLLSPSPE